MGCGISSWPDLENLICKYGEKIILIFIFFNLWHCYWYVLIYDIVFNIRWCRVVNASITRECKYFMNMNFQRYILGKVITILKITMTFWQGHNNMIKIYLPFILSQSHYMNSICHDWFIKFVFTRNQNVNIRIHTESSAKYPPRSP